LTNQSNHTHTTQRRNIDTDTLQIQIHYIYRYRYKAGAEVLAYGDTSELLESNPFIEGNDMENAFCGVPDE